LRSDGWKIDGAAIGAGDFCTLVHLCNELSPDLKKKSPWLREVSVYYRAVEKLEHAFRVKLPAISGWAKGEMQICSRYVAVVLDQSLSMSLDRQFATRTKLNATGVGSPLTLIKRRKKSPLYAADPSRERKRKKKSGCSVGKDGGAVHY